MQNHDTGAVEPSAHAIDSRLYIHGFPEHTWMSHDTNETTDADPRQSYGSFSIEQGLPPSFCFCMMGSLVIVRVDQKIDVG